PSIGFDAFEVGDEVVDAFASATYDLDALVGRNAKTGKAHIDLWEANKSDLLRAGVSEELVEVAEVCTYTHHELFFSARRLGIKSGRIVSGIVIR
ncbi:MAG: laccase domain-containing protein, partial [Tannerellaceae bacterium]